MNIHLRRTIFTVYAIFFIISAPFLVILSLGYNLDIEEQSLKNTITINIETFPRRAKIPTKTKEFRTPVELRVDDGVAFDLSIENEGYMTEKFSFDSPEGENSTARIFNLWMLPLNSVILTNFQDSVPLKILSEGFVLSTKDGKYYIQNYGIAGTQSKAMEVTQVPVETPIKINQSGAWQNMFEEAFWKVDQNLLLRRNSNNWEVINLDILPFEITTVGLISESQSLLLDKDGSLWILDLDTLEYYFIDSGYSGLSYTTKPDFLWLYKDNIIYRQPFLNSRLTPQDFDTQQKEFINTSKVEFIPSELDLQKDENFVAKKLYLGMSFKLNDLVIYFSDISEEDWRVIANNVVTYNTHSNTVFWIDQNNSIYTYDLLLQKNDNLGQINPSSKNTESYRFSYSKDWSRVLFYTENQVYSVWYDTQYLNHSITKYNLNKWIDEQACYPELNNTVQYCISDDKLLIYRNSSINIGF